MGILVSRQALVERAPGNALRFLLVPALDTSRPNIHDSKAEFQAELEKVKGALSGLHAALAHLDRPAADDDLRQKAAYGRFQSAIDQSARKRVAGLKSTSAFQLIRKNKAEVGLLHSSVLALVDLSFALEERREELELQGKEFWSVKNRPPNYYARAIALRLARLYARARGKKPTFGTARDGGHPSTDFGRALEEVFSIIEIRANVRRAAEWAIAELTEDDLKPLPMGSILGMSAAARYGFFLSEDEQQ